MKKIIRILFISFLAVPCVLSAQAQQIMGGEAEVTNLSVDRTDNTVNIKMSIDVTNLAVGGDETVILTPVLSNEDQSLDLPSVEIMGRRAYLHYLRGGENPVSDNAAYAERTARRSERKEGPQIIDYTTSLAYEPWMTGSLVSIREGSCGCSNTLLAQGENPLDRVLPPPYVPQYVASFAEPEPEPVKVRDEKFSAHINFQVGRWAILENYLDNASELSAILASFDKVKHDEDLTITSVTIEGWASPEGAEDYNQRLSQQRADALADYIASRCGIERTSIRSTGCGEDWAGLCAGIERMPASSDRDRAMSIIDDANLSQDTKERELKKQLPSETYKQLYDELYPVLRRNDYRIVYNVRNFDPQEARAVLDIQPRKLSLGEMYQIAGLYEKDSEAYNHVLEVAARTYPAQPVAAVNHALLLIEEGEYKAAVTVLRKSDPADARVLNALGLAYARLGDTDAAREAWTKASQKGSADADHNLEELAKSLE